MSDDGSAAERAVVSQARARLAPFAAASASRQPLKLVAVPRDHVHGDRQRGEALLAGRLHGRQRDALRSRTSISRAVGAGGAAGRAAAGLLLASRPRRRRLAREGRAAGRSDGRPLAARARRQGRRRLGAASVGRAHPLLDRLCALHPVEQRQRLSLGAAQHAGARRPAPRSAVPTRRRPGSTGSPPGAAWSPPACSSRAASRASRAARRGSPARWPRRSSTTAGWSAARRSSRCCWSTASACCAPATRPPSRPFPKGSRPRRRRRSPRFMAS